jgi:hypothetical protein
MEALFVAILFFSKVNINSNIYDVYKDIKLKDKILDELILKLNQDMELIDVDKSRYKFCDLEKDFDQRVVVGRLVKIFEGENENYVPEKDTVDVIPSENCASHITFYFDLKTEILVFPTKRNFGHSQFNDHFKELINNYFEDTEFEIFLEKSIDELRTKLSNFKQILRADVTIIPPNANDEEFKKLLGLDFEEFKETNATKYKQTLTTSKKNKEGVNWKSKFFERMFLGIGKGYGEMVVEGKDGIGNQYTVNSDEDAPLTRPIPENEKDSIASIKEYAKKYIPEIISVKSRMKLSNEESK